MSEMIGQGQAQERGTTPIELSTRSLARMAIDLRLPRVTPLPDGSNLLVSCDAFGGVIELSNPDGTMSKMTHSSPAGESLHSTSGGDESNYVTEVLQAPGEQTSDNERNDTAGPLNDIYRAMIAASAIQEAETDMHVQA